ncbi:ABC transporter G family member 21-like isoform X2 [Benincasa hispida]|uniref:ABC transporter G family member 21-like isoform X2 n=1 Tax=Benincasa hispida TaxID=102211 RepID=UPI001900CC11|nr:ABC transporter G family member 21-like isoform X2 [Benincasa hispida]
MLPLEQDTTTTTATTAISHPRPDILIHAVPSASDTFSILRQSRFSLTLKFEDVSYSIKLQTSKRSCLSLRNESQSNTTRTILNGVSGVVRSGELLAMLGTSGSGKTTLLTALAARLPGKISGAITYNDKPFSSSMKRKIGFVSQDDVLYPHLTVLETLTYAAMLRLPKELSRDEKVAQAETIIVELGLTRCRNSVVGGGLLRGISGGERKRVSIGHEMIVNPSLLLLDEPTSGLDSTTAQRIVATLRGLARGGRTLVMTIHQPSTRLYSMFDKVVVLSDGSPIYSGPAARVMPYFESIGYVPPFNLINPADFLLDLANGIVPDSVREDQVEHFHGGSLDHQDDQNSVKQSLIASFRKNLYPELKAEILNKTNFSTVDSRTDTPRGRRENEWMTNWWEQFSILLKRGLRERRHESYSGLRIFQVMSVSFLSGLLWWHSDPSHIQDQVGLIFFFSIFWGFFPLFNAIFAFPLERPMLNKERSSGMYRLSSYYMARTAGDLPMELVLPTVFVTVTYWMGGLNPSLIPFLLTLLVVLLNVLVSQGLGLALGAILMEVKQATTLASVTMLVFLLVGFWWEFSTSPSISCMTAPLHLGCMVVTADWGIFLLLNVWGLGIIVCGGMWLLWLLCCLGIGFWLFLL